MKPFIHKAWNNLAAALATTPGGDLLEQAARVAYRICAEARHVTLGDKAAAAIRALKPAGDGGEA